MSLTQFNQERRVLHLRSRLLGCDIVVAADQAVISPTETRPVYRVAEVRQLITAGVGPEGIRCAHAVKVAFEGKIVGREEAESL